MRNPTNAAEATIQDRIKYEEYRQKVIQACVELFGEESRTFWKSQCSWENEYTDMRDPHEVAQDQYDALT